MICKWNLLFWRLDLASVREKKDLIWWPCQSPEKDGDPATRPVKQINKIIQLLKKISTRFTQADYSNNKAHTRAIKLVIYSDICWLLSVSSTSLVLVTMVSVATLHKRPEAPARYYVTLAGGVGQETHVKNYGVTSPPPHHWSKHLWGCVRATSSLNDEVPGIWFTSWPLFFLFFLQLLLTLLLLYFSSSLLTSSSIVAVLIAKAGYVWVSWPEEFLLYFVSQTLQQVCYCQGIG